MGGCIWERKIKLVFLLLFLTLTSETWPIKIVPMSILNIFDKGQIITI